MTEWLFTLLYFTYRFTLLFSHSVVSDSLQPYRLQHTRLPYPTLSPGIFSNSCLLSRWCHPTISSYVTRFSSCPQSFPESGSFPVSWLFASSDQSIGTSASALVLPMNIQSWSPLGVTGLIFLQSTCLLQCFQFESINSSVLSLLYGPSLISIHDHWKNQSFDYMDLCQQSDVTAF